MNIVFTEQLITLLKEHVTHTETGLAALDANDRFVFFNKSFANMFGVYGHLQLGDSFKDMLTHMYKHGVGTKCSSPTLDAWLEEAYTEFRSQPFRSFELDMVDGRWLLMLEQVNENGNVVLVGNDITRAKKAELELKAAKEILKQQALTDELTGISNRRHFMQLLQNEFHRARRYQRTSSLVVVDIDFFKKINDSLGHPAGDEVLRHFAAFLQAQLRKQDSVGRLGGEEFALLLPETSASEAVCMIERVQKELRSATLDTIAPDFHYTFSAGVAELLSNAESDVENWLSNADKALYEAKRTGRNKVVLFQT